MTCRPIVLRETEEFLRLLCEVFELDLVQARHVFYNEPLYNIKRKWALFVDGRMASILSTSPLEFGFGRAIGIAGVATRPEHRGKGLAEQLLTVALAQAERDGEGPAVLFAHQAGLYERVGFRHTDSVIRAQLRLEEMPRDHTSLSYAEIRSRYDAWSEESPLRLRRDEARWSVWEWTLKDPVPAPGGYIALEPMVIREAVFDPAMAAWPVPPDCPWYGLESMTARLGVPVLSSEPALMVMTRNMPEGMEMFMTDQF